MTQAENDVVMFLRQQQHSFSSIAQTTGLPLGTIKSFLSRVSGKIDLPVAAPRITVDGMHYKQYGAPLDQSKPGKSRSFCDDH